MKWRTRRNRGFLFIEPSPALLDYWKSLPWSLSTAAVDEALTRGAVLLSCAEWTQAGPTKPKTRLTRQKPKKKTSGAEQHVKSFAKLIIPIPLTL